MGDLFPEMMRKRRPRRVIMQVTDSGDGMAGYPFGAELRCPKCGYRTGWMCFTTVSEIRRQACRRPPRGATYL